MIEKARCGVQVNTNEFLTVIKSWKSTDQLSEEFNPEAKSLTLFYNTNGEY